MPRSNSNAGRNEIAYAFAYRKDGSVRQLLVQENSGSKPPRLIDQGYFAPGTSKAQAESGEGKRYHWVDAFTDAELAEHYQMSAELIAQTRKSSVTANALNEFVHRGI